jgi:hypothetical protein
MVHPLVEGTKPISRYVEPGLHPVNHPSRGGMNGPGKVGLEVGH